MENLIKGLRQGEFKVRIREKDFIESTFLGELSYIYDEDNEHVYVCIEAEDGICMTLRKEDLTEILKGWKKGFD